MTSETSTATVIVAVSLLVAVLVVLFSAIGIAAHDYGGSCGYGIGC